MFLVFNQKYLRNLYQLSNIQIDTPFHIFTHLNCPSVLHKLKKVNIAKKKLSLKNPC